MRRRGVQETICSLILGILVLVSLVSPASAEGAVGSFTVALTISNVSVSGISYGSSVVTWETNDYTTSQVFYDRQVRNNIEEYAYHTAEGVSLVSQHSATLTGLSPSTTYHYRVKSRIPGTDFIAISYDYTFTTLSAPASGGGGGGAPPPAPPAPVNLTQTDPASGMTLVTETGLFLDSRGIAQTASRITTSDGNISFNVASGTQLLNAQGQPLTSMSVSVATSVPPPPSQSAIALTYDFGPAGATFAPPLTLTLKYAPTTLPPGVSEDTLYTAYWDGSQWQKLTSTVDTQAKTVTALLSHFTLYALMGKPAAATPPAAPAAFTVSDLSISPAEVSVGESVTISILVTNTGDLTGSYKVTLKIDGVAVDTSSVTLSGGASKAISFTVDRYTAGTYDVDVNGLSGAFEVGAAPALTLSVSDITIEPSEVRPSELITATVTVANSSNETVTESIILKINGVKEAEEIVIVLPGSSRQVSFSFSREEAGSYTVDINGLSGSFTVVEEAGGTVIIWVISGVAVVAAAAISFVVIRRRRRKIEHHHISDNDQEIEDQP